MERINRRVTKYHDAGEGWIPRDFVDRSEALFGDLCGTQRNVRLLHGDLHHYNVLFDVSAGWVAMPFEQGVGPDLRAPFALAARSMHELLD